MKGPLILIGALATLAASSLATRLSVGMNHDMSKATYGLQGQSSSSLNYDDQNGLRVSGTLGDLLGPPIKIATGVNSMLKGSAMTGLGQSLNSGAAVLGLDAKLLEAAGGLKLAKGGLLLGGGAAKKALAGAVAGPAGKKIASIIELPVKVVAMKDLAGGAALAGAGALKASEAQSERERADQLLSKGQTLKQQGLEQVREGATESMQSLGNFMQKTSNQMNTAVQYLPLVLEAQQQQQQQHTEPTKSAADLQQQQQHLESGGLFGGLSSILRGGANANSAAPNGLNPLAPFSSATSQLLGGNPMAFGLGGPSPAYAAALNRTSPFLNLLSHPQANPFLLPSPLIQAFSGLAPIGTPEAAAAGGQSNLQQHPQQQQLQQHHFQLGISPPGRTTTSSFNLLPGIKVTERTNELLPGAAQISQQQQVAQAPVQQAAAKSAA